MQGSEAQDKGDSKNHGMQEPDVYVVLWAPAICFSRPSVRNSSKPTRTYL